MGIFNAILENGDKAGSITILLLVIAALIAGQISGYVEIGPGVKERKTALKEGNTALEKSQESLRKVEVDLIKLQLEKEFLWRQMLPQSPASPQRTVNKRRKL